MASISDHSTQSEITSLTFVHRAKKLIIELDGSQHLEQKEYDEERSAFLKSKGYRILRFWNSDVMNNTESVLTVIWDTLKEQNKPKNQK